MEPISFLSVDDVLELHAGQISSYGGATGIRDRGLLESAVAQPAMTFDGKYLHTDLFLMAAAYLYHLVQNHPFVDGNKRVGLEAALVFLELNGFTVDTTDELLVDLVLSVASESNKKESIADFLRKVSASI